MTLYSIDVVVYATAYIRADKPAQARAIAKQLAGNAFELPEGDYEGVRICGLEFGSDELPDVSLSPAMTIHGPHEDDQVEEV